MSRVHYRVTFNIACPGIGDEIANGAPLDRSRIPVWVLHGEIGRPLDVGLLHSNRFQAVRAVEFLCQIDQGLYPAAAAEGASNRLISLRCRLCVVGHGVRQDDRVRVRVGQIEGPTHHMTKLVMQRHTD